MTENSNDPTVKSGSDVDGWGSLEHQQVFSYYTIDPEHVQDGRNVYVLERAKAVEPLEGDLGDDESAELVSVEISICKGFVSPTGNEGANPGLVMIEAELSFDPESMIEAAAKDHVDTVGGEPFEPDTEYGQTVNPGDHVTVRNASSVNSDVLWFGESRNYTAFKDDESGAGGGATAEESSTRYFKNYRREYGAGPVVDGSAELYEHLFINVGTEQNPVVGQSFGGILGYTLVWDVREDAT
jgi:hypothetical protein